VPHEEGERAATSSEVDKSPQPDAEKHKSSRTEAEKAKSPRSEGGKVRSPRSEKETSSNPHGENEKMKSPRSDADKARSPREGEKLKSSKTESESTRREGERSKSVSDKVKSPRSIHRSTSTSSKSSETAHAVKSPDTKTPPHVNVPSVPAKPKSNHPEIESLLESLKKASSDLMAQSAMDPEKFDKVIFNRFAKELVDAAEALYKIDNSKPVKAYRDEVKVLVDVTIKLLKAKKAGAKKYRQKFVKETGKFTQVHETLLTHCEQKYGISRNTIVQQHKAEDVMKRLGAGRAQVPKASKDSKKEDEKKKKERDEREKSRQEKKKEKEEDKELLALLKDSNKRLDKEVKEVKPESKKSSSRKGDRKGTTTKKEEKEEKQVEQAAPSANIVEAWDDDDDDSDEGEGDMETLFLEKEIVFVADQYEKAKKFVENGNVGAFEDAVSGMQVNMQDISDNSNTLLHWAVGFNRLEMVRSLLMKGARNLANDVGMTPLEIAVGAVESGDYSFFEVRNLLAITLN
jgi:hypothetical protein